MKTVNFNEGIMIASRPPKDSIPLHSKLARMKIDPSWCLNHVHTLTRTIDYLQNSPYVVCMGPMLGMCLHCWLEAGEIVVDLTRPVPRQRFYVRSAYYALLQIEIEQIKRYTFSDVVRKAFESGDMAAGPKFWDFQTDDYFTFDPKRHG